MTFSTSTLEARADGVQAVIDVAQAAAGPHELEPGAVHVVALGNGQHKVIDLTAEEYRDAPSRKRGVTTVRDVASFLAYFDKHADEDSEVYADVQQRRITAVLDAHTADDARWGGHRLVLALRHTDAWAAWTDADGKLMMQAAFAEFIDDNLADLVEPDSATMLEIAESFSATTKAEFQSSTRLASGERKFGYVEDTQAKAGARGDITIPATLKLALRPFEGSEPYAVTAKFRYRLEKTELRLGIKLERPGDVLAAAFEDVRTLIDNGVEPPVLNGSPA